MRGAAVGIIVVGLLLAAAPAGAAGPRLTVGPVQGDARTVIPRQLAELLCGRYDCVLWKEVSTRNLPDLAKARALDVDGILTGAVEAAAGGKKLTLSLFTTSPRPARTWSVPLTAAGRLPASAARQVEQEVDAMLRRPAPPAAPPPPAEIAPPPAASTPMVVRPPAHTPAPPSAERPWLAAAELGLFASQRRLTYGGVSASTGTLLGFDAGSVAGPTVSLELFPLAHGASTALGGVGLHAGLAMSVGLQTLDGAGVKRPTRFTRLELGACWRAPPLTGLELVLVPELAWVSQRLTVSPAITGLPDSDLSGLRVKLSAEARVASRVTILAGVAWVKWLTAGELIEGAPAFFPGSSAAGLEAEVGVGVAVSGPLSLRVLGQYASTRYTLDPDPTGTYAARSAEDRILGLRAVARGQF